MSKDKFALVVEFDTKEQALLVADEIRGFPTSRMPVHPTSISVSQETKSTDGTITIISIQRIK